MVQINFAQKSVTVKIVYYGPGMSGKTTNLEVVHQRAPDGSRGDLTSISTDGDRTLFFDFMPLDLGTVAGMKTQFQIYTVPGQVYYNSTRKLVLQGVDGVIFVADSSASMLEENLESLRNLEENLAEYGKDLSTMPMVVQYNKRDLPDALPVDELERALNPMARPSFEAVANTGQGVFPTLKALAAVVLDSIHERTGGGSSTAPPASQPVASAGSAQVAEAPMPTREAPGSPVSAAQTPAAPESAAAHHMGHAPSTVPEPPHAPAEPVMDPVGMQDSMQLQREPAATHQEPAPMPEPLQMQQPMHQEPAAMPEPMQMQQPMHQEPAPMPEPLQMQQPMQQEPAAMSEPMQMQQPMQEQAVQPALQEEAGLRISQPVATASPAPAARPHTPSSMMQVPEGTTAAPPPSTSRSLPTSPAPRIKPRRPAATPVQASARRSAVITGVFMTAALVAGVIIGGLTFGLF